MSADIATNWKELSGKNNWEGLLNPLDINIRQCLIHYGERVQAIYDSIDYDENSSSHGFSLYTPKDLFSNVGLEKGNPYKYEVTNYIYALSDIHFAIDWFVKDRSALIGYVAVATDEGKVALGRRDILICWRGTQSVEDWLKNINFLQNSAKDILKGTDNPEVHNGFHSLYTSKDKDSPYNKSSAREQVLKAVWKLVDKYKDEEISITISGHSLGSALATLNAVDIVSNGYNKPKGSNTPCMVTVFAFASSMVGDSAFLSAFKELRNLHLLRIQTKKDPVPSLPLGDYRHVGEELGIEIPSKYLDIPFWRLAVVSHNLEIYLHGVAGPQEDGTWLIKRDHSLVNKSLNVLKKEYGIPAEWWEPVKNKGMVQQENGTWMVKKRWPRTFSRL